MTHEGRMKRGEANLKAGLLDNEDTKYFQANSEKKEEEKPKKKVKKESKE